MEILFIKKISVVNFLIMSRRQGIYINSEVIKLCASFPLREGLVREQRGQFSSLPWAAIYNNQTELLGNIKHGRNVVQ